MVSREPEWRSTNYYPPWRFLYVRSHLVLNHAWPMTYQRHAHACGTDSYFGMQHEPGQAGRVSRTSSNSTQAADQTSSLVESGTFLIIASGAMKPSEPGASGGMNPSESGVSLRLVAATSQLISKSEQWRRRTNESSYPGKAHTSITTLEGARNLTNQVHVLRVVGEQNVLGFDITMGKA